MINLLLNLLFPQKCPTCQNRSDTHLHSPFCSTCWSSILPYTGAACKRCGLPLSSSLAKTCSECTSNPPGYISLRSFGIHEGTLRTAIHYFKYKRQRRLAPPLGKLLLKMDLPKTDFVVPVPLHPAKLYQRQFNQAALLAGEIAKNTGMALELHGLIKTRNTPPQVGLRRSERVKNELNAFGVTANHIFNNMRILIVDDVCTTGTTIRACSRVLMEAGAESVYAVTLARSTPDVWQFKKI